MIRLLINQIPLLQTFLQNAQQLSMQTDYSTALVLHTMVHRTFRASKKCANKKKFLAVVAHKRQPTSLCTQHC